jgi:type VI secretion system protein VasG
VFDRTAGEGITVLDKDFWRPELMNPWTANNYRNGNYSWHVLSQRFPEITPQAPAARLDT